jgi:hypothetical protein
LARAKAGLCERLLQAKLPPDATPPTPQDNQLMSKHRGLSLKPHFRGSRSILSKDLLVSETAGAQLLKTATGGDRHWKKVPPITNVAASG